MTPVALAAAALASLAVAASLLVAIRRAARPAEPTRRVLDAVTRVAAGWATFGLAGIAAAISYQHLLTLAIRHGESGWRAHAFPLSVDGLEVVAALVLLSDRRNGRSSGWLPWAALVGATAASLSANIMVAPHDAIARAIAAWPALALITATKLFFGLADPPAPAPVPQPAAAATTQESSDDPPGPAQPEPGAEAGSAPARLRGDRLPVELMRRIPVDADAYQRWLAVWDDLRRDGADPRAVAEAHRISLRQAQFVRRAGEIGLLDSPVPPAIRMAGLAPDPENRG